jgi:regulatory protein
VARAICLRLLTGAAKSRADLAKALERRNVPDEVAERVLDRFGEVGLIDDAAFARAWVGSRQRGRGLARRALALELARRGIDTEHVEEALAEVSDDDELIAARALVQRRLAATRGLPTEARVRRLTGLLARKGYSGGIARAVVREALEAENAQRQAAEWELDQLLDTN